MVEGRRKGSEGAGEAFFLTCCPLGLAFLRLAACCLQNGSTPDFLLLPSFPCRYRQGRCTPAEQE